MANDSPSRRCGCGDDSSKQKGPCPSAGKKSGFSKTPCKPPGGGKGKCHESHEKFKQPYKESSDNHQSECNSSKNDCHESYKKFLRSSEADCSDSRAQERSICDESQKKNDPCTMCQATQPKTSPCPEPQHRSEPCSNQSSQPKVSPCSGKEDKKQDICGNSSEELKVQDCQSQKKSKPCGESPKRKESPCGSKKEKQPEDSLYSKITCRCKSLAKDFVKIRSKTKCTSVEEPGAQKNRKCSGVEEPLHKEICGTPAPPSGAPCPPKTEKGAASSQPCCTSKVTCAEPKMPSWADFFPLDARNKKLNKCIEKYSKIDPSKVISECSRFANQTMDTSSRCLENMKKMQQQCVQDSKRSGAGGADSVSKKTSALLSTRTRVMMRRWAPTAAVYLATAALLSVYVTEWKAVMPLYREDDDKDKE